MWVTKKDKDQAILQYLLDTRFYTQFSLYFFIFVRDKQRVLEVTDLLLESGCSLLSHHKDYSLLQSAEAWDINDGKRRLINVASLQSDALDSFYDPDFVEFLLVDFPSSVKEYMDFSESLDWCIYAFICEDDEHLIPTLLNVITWPRWSIAWMDTTETSRVI